MKRVIREERKLEMEREREREKGMHRQIVAHTNQERNTRSWEEEIVSRKTVTKRGAAQVKIRKPPPNINKEHTPLQPEVSTTKETIRSPQANQTDQSIEDSQQELRNVHTKDPTATGCQQERLQTNSIRSKRGLTITRQTPGQALNRTIHTLAKLKKTNLLICLLREMLWETSSRDIHMLPIRAGEVTTIEQRSCDHILVESQRSQIDRDMITKQQPDLRQGSDNMTIQMEDLNVRLTIATTIITALAKHASSQHDEFIFLRTKTILDQLSLHANNEIGNQAFSRYLKIPSEIQRFLYLYMAAHAYDRVYQESKVSNTKHCKEQLSHWLMRAELYCKPYILNSYTTPPPVMMRTPMIFVPAVLHALTLIGKIGAVEQIVKTMKFRSAKLLTPLLHAYLQISDARVISLFAKIEDPDQTCWNILLTYHARNGNTKQFDLALQKFRDANISWNVKLLNTVIHGLGTTQRPKASLDLYLRMRNAGISDIHSYTSCLNAIVKSHRKVPRFAPMIRRISAHVPTPHEVQDTSSAHDNSDRQRMWTVVLEALLKVGDTRTSSQVLDHLLRLRKNTGSGFDGPTVLREFGLPSTPIFGLLQKYRYSALRPRVRNWSKLEEFKEVRGRARRGYRANRSEVALPD